MVSTGRRSLVAAACVAAISLSLGQSIEAKPPPPSLGASMAKLGYVAVPLKRMQTGLIGADVTINGNPGLFIVDTGAGATVVDDSQLTRFGIGESLRQGTGIGAGGRVTIQMHPITSFAIGGKPFPFTRIYSTDLGPAMLEFKKADKLDVSGVVGQDFLVRYGAVIDVKGLTLYLKQP